MNKIVKRIDDEINRIWEEANKERNGKAPYIVIGLEKAKKIIEIDCCNKCREDYNQLDKDYTAILEENDRLEYQKRLSAVQTKKYIEIIDSLMVKNEKLAKKKAKKSESISRTPEQVEKLASDFWELSTESLNLLKELQKVNYECKYWEAEAKKAVAKLGEIRILMDGGKING